MNTLQITIAFLFPLHVILEVTLFKDVDCQGEGFTFSSSAAELPTALKNSLSSFLVVGNAVLAFFQNEEFNGKHAGESYVYNCKSSNATKCTNLGVLERRMLSFRFIEHSLTDELIMFSKENFGGNVEKAGTNDGKITIVKHDVVSLVILGGSAWTLCDHAKCNDNGRNYCMFPSSGKYYWPTVFKNLYKELLPYDFKIRGAVLGCYWRELQKNPSSFWGFSFY